VLAPWTGGGVEREGGGVLLGDGVGVTLSALVVAS